MADPSIIYLEVRCQACNSMIVEWNPVGGSIRVTCKRCNRRWLAVQTGSVVTVSEVLAEIGIDTGRA